MLKKIPLKTKIIIYIVACIAALIMLIDVGIQNRRDVNISNSTPKIQNQNVKIIAGEDSANEEKSRKLEEEKRKEEIRKELDDKYEKGYNAFSNKKYSEAISIQDEVIKEDASFYKAYNVKGIALCYLGKFDEGMKNIDKSLELNPGFGYARFNKALAYELFEHYDEAITWYNKNLEVENFIWSYYGIASIYGRRGDVDNTIKYLKIAIDINSSIKEEARNEEDFAPVRNSKEFQELIK